MTRISQYRTIFLLASLGAVACKKVIQVNLNNATPQIVIEGNVTNGPGPYQVLISRSVDFSASNTFPPVSGATVSIIDSTTGAVEQLRESDSGVYITHYLSGTPLHTYELLVIVDGLQYAASSTMPSPVALDSVTFSENTGFNNKMTVNAVVNFLDPPGVTNYYQFTELVNSRLIPNVFVFEDRLSDGRYIEDPLFNDSSYMQKGDTLLLTMNCVDQNTYNYFFTLANVTGNNSFQSTTPANPISNLSNGALGYFSAHTTTAERLLVY
jgi:hypothetical protein